MDLIPFDEAAFSLGEAAILANVPPRRVTVWYQRGHIDFGERVGPKKRALTTWEVFELAVVGQLVNRGLPIDVAADWAAESVAALRSQRDLDGIPSLSALAAELERGDEILGLFVYDRPFVQGVARTLKAIERRGTKAEAPPLSSFSFVAISQILYTIAAAAPQIRGRVQADEIEE